MFFLRPTESLKTFKLKTSTLHFCLSQWPINQSLLKFYFLHIYAHSCVYIWYMRVHVCEYVCVCGSQNHFSMSSLSLFFFKGRVFHWPRTCHIGWIGWQMSPRDPLRTLSLSLFFSLSLPLPPSPLELLQHTNILRRCCGFLYEVCKSNSSPCIYKALYYILFTNYSAWKFSPDSHV